MLIRYSSSLGEYEFVTRHNYSGKNKYSVIVGKNGTGKSRLLKSIIEGLLKRISSHYRFEREERHIIERPLNENLYFDFLPRKIIAVSTSPFDRFPIPRRNDYFLNSEMYSYLGLRDVQSSNLGLGYMSKIINSLIDSIVREPQKSRSISQVLNYLGYSDVLGIRFQLLPTIKRMESILKSLEPEMEFENYVNSNVNRSIDRTFYIGDDGRFDNEKLYRTFNIFQRILAYTSKPRLDLFISRDGITVDDINFDIDDDFLFLIRSGIAKLRDVSLEKYETGHRFKISEASSGEQSVVMGILAIASQIEDGSLICIDEPEVCLHPEWQEKYISLLISTFGYYHDCHFIIATHSPQIVSNLEDENCFVTSMDEGLAINSSELNNKSIDFQLANTFKSPGHRNEYLTREFITVLTMFSNGEKIPCKQLEKIKELLNLENVIEVDDPVKKLMGMVREVVEDYC